MSVSVNGPALIRILQYTSITRYLWCCAPIDSNYLIVALVKPAVNLHGAGILGMVDNDKSNGPLACSLVEVAAVGMNLLSAVFDRECLDPFLVSESWLLKLNFAIDSELR